MMVSKELYLKQALNVSLLRLFSKIGALRFIRTLASIHLVKNRGG